MNGHLMDGVSWRILALLQENARISFSEIGRRVGLTSTAVAERMRRLEDARIIRGYKLDVGTDMLGYSMTVFIRVAVRPGASAQVVRLAESMTEVLECYRITGDDSYLLKAVVTSVQHLEQLLMRIRPLGQPATSVVLSSVITHPVVPPSTSNGHSSGNGEIKVNREELGVRTA